VRLERPNKVRGDNHAVHVEALERAASVRRRHSAGSPRHYCQLVSRIRRRPSLGVSWKRVRYQLL